MGKYVLDSGYWVDVTFNSLVESAKVRYPADCVVFLGNNECTTYPRRATSRRENTSLDESIEFCFEFRSLGSRNRVSSTSMRRDVFVHIKMYRFVRVMLEDSIKHQGVILKDTVK